jgi:hypothetical protein
MYNRDEINAAVQASNAFNLADADFVRLFPQIAEVSLVTLYMANVFMNGIIC